MKVKSKGINDFTKAELEELATNGQVIDVRSTLERFFGKVKGATHVPLMKVSNFDGPKDKTYYVYCASGMRSQRACEELAAKGYKTVNLKGGYGSFTNK
ncbi:MULTISPECIES: rhodanese-like domain-containing protein [Nosocomiicoccus]|uniref:rhodanese-like domain-containing protein n=1 Tax=Nosocomiicoccus TaxID=489909 RepID=UPI0008344948|nr:MULTISPECIES: rhodanese-like domain-containing protein [Nosocomiicoccus]MDK6862886.1 rhodanese-like domain-containing protein [Nosocomiicoccus ampullae]OFL47227.1 hypothetical protein HMPREF2767_03460 [Nosocomiicoccus sp. HMSC067E10]OFO54078.1 hypothetical protein HMPREF3029_01170 [Nosocomiicoccus sp. HMSC059G07]